MRQIQINGFLAKLAKGHSVSVPMEMVGDFVHQAYINGMIAEKITTRYDSALCIVSEVYTCTAFLN